MLLNEKFYDSAFSLIFQCFILSLCILLCTIIYEILPLRYCLTLARISVSSMLIPSYLDLEKTMLAVEILLVLGAHLNI